MSKFRGELIKKHPKRRLIIESPAFRENYDQGQPDTYWRVSWDDFLIDRGNYNNAGSPPDRFLRIMKEQMFTVLPASRARPNGYIVLMMQKDSDASLRNQDIGKWAKSTIIRIRELTDREIVVRLHPLENRVLHNFGNFFNVRVSNTPLLEDLEGAWATVTYTSLSSIESVCAGVPTWTLHPGNLAYPVTHHDLSLIEDPPEQPLRKQWLYNLGYTQWRLSEIRSGLAWAHLRPFYFNEDGSRR